jgi:hypothetical protein
MISEPRYLGHTWSATALWVGAAVYVLASVVFGLLGWRNPPAP